jgi:hypothetical protein
LAVSGNHLVDNGNVVILRGVNRSGSEYACYQNFGFFDGPSDDASIAAIAAWGSNAIRVPLNEDCWLGINGVPAAYSGANYQAAITGFVTRLRAHGLYVILSNQVAGPGTTKSTTILPMPDADHAPTFWSQVANTFKTDKGVIFDLYNEPHDVSWSCWANGCLVTGGVNFVTQYQAAGMTTLTNAIRTAGASNVILIAGLSWSYDISGWLANRPNDGQLIAGIHNYGASGYDTPAIWNNIYLPTAQQVPVTFGEMGFDVYIETLMPWADAHGIGYLAWTWDTWGNREALITNYNGAPTTYGLGFKNYLAGLGIPTPTPTPPPTPTPTPTPIATPTPSPTPTPAPPTVSSVAPNSGLTAGGTSVTITGTNFTGATAVKFGTSAAASFMVNAATQITATSPLGTGVVDVRVTTAGGMSTVSVADRFTYTSAPLPFKGLYTLDGFGGIHGDNSPPVTVSAYWPGWSIARTAKALPGASAPQTGFVLDGYGGLHSFGSPAVVESSGASGHYWGWDIARDFAFLPDGTGGFVLDGYGGLHPFRTNGNSAPLTAQGTGYWAGWDIARKVVIFPDGSGGYVLDGWGGLHPFGINAPPPTGTTNVAVTGYWPGWNIARDIALVPGNGNHSGYVLDGYGGTHAFHPTGDGSMMPAAISATYWGWDIARGVWFLPGSSTAGYTLDGYGGMHAFGGSPAITSSSYWPGWDIAKGVLGA